jgi:hypothetical protein
VRLHSLKRTVLVAGALGIVVPAFSLIANHLDPKYGIGKIASRLWPSSIILGATIGHEYEPSAYAVIAISLTANILLYAIVGGLLWLGIRLIQRLIE